MIKKNRIFIITVISAALFIGSLVALAGRSQDNKQNPRKVDDSSLAKQIDDEATPIVDLQNPAMIRHVPLLTPAVSLESLNGVPAFPTSRSRPAILLLRQ